MPGNGWCRWSATAALAVVMAAASAEAQRPVEKPTEAILDRTRLAPDLEVVLSPVSSDAAPARFTVRNKGLGNAGSSSLLRVSIRVLPITAESVNEAVRLNRGLGGSFSADAGSYRQMANRCGMPFSDFEAAIDPLRASGSQVVTPRSAGTAGRDVPRAIADALAGPNTNLPGSRLVALGYRLACVYEVRVVVDADGQLSESDERNNEVVHRFERIVYSDILHYVRCEDRALACP